CARRKISRAAAKRRAIFPVKRKARSGLRVVSGHRAYEINHAATNLGVLDTHERLVELDPFRARQEVHHVVRLFRLGHTRNGLAVRTGSILKEERYRDRKDAGDMLQAAGADAVGALLVFLDL